MKPYISRIIEELRSREQVEFDETSVDRVLDWWQRALGLHDWTITLQRIRGFRLPNCYGHCETYLRSRRAFIKIVCHDDLEPQADPMDDEETIVHELLHVAFAANDDKLREGGRQVSDIEEAVCVEQPIEHLSRLLVALRRAPRGDMP